MHVRAASLAVHEQKEKKKKCRVRSAKFAQARLVWRRQAYRESIYYVSAMAAICGYESRGCRQNN